MTLLQLAVLNFRDEYGSSQPPTVEIPDRGPRECCARYAIVVDCDGDTDSWMCPFGHTWTAPCPNPTV